MSIKPEEPKADLSGARYPDFADRITQAADLDPNIPPLNRGRLTYIQDVLQKKYGRSVSLESVRRWFGGMTLPREEVSIMLAEILKVDRGWLMTGQDFGLSARERKVYQHSSSAAVNLIASLISFDGGTPSPQGKEDGDDSVMPINLKAIIRGVSYDLHVVHLTERDGHMTGIMPRALPPCVILAVVREDAFKFRVYEIPQDELGQFVADAPKRPTLDLRIGDVSALREITTFRERL